MVVVIMNAVGLVQVCEVRRTSRVLLPDQLRWYTDTRLFLHSFPFEMFDAKRF